MTFASPALLWLLVFVPAMLVVHFVSLKKIKRKAIVFANYEAMEKVYGQKILSRNYPLLTMRTLMLVLLVFAVSGTAIVYDVASGKSDFVLAIDASGSMLAEDYKPNRLEAAKNASLLFVDSLPAETSIAVVSFAGAAFIQQEMTKDADSARSAISSIEIELMGGTAVGEALISSTNAIIGTGNERTIILLTDGKNNVGPSIDEALAYAKKYRVVVDTIGIGTPEGDTLVNTSYVIGLDETEMERIANETGGSYFRAASTEDLSEAFGRLIQESSKRATLDLSFHLIVAGLVVFLLEMFLMNTKYRTIP